MRSNGLITALERGTKLMIMIYINYPLFYMLLTFFFYILLKDLAFRIEASSSFVPTNGRVIDSLKFLRRI